MRAVPFLFFLTASLAFAAEALEADKRIVQTIQRLGSFNYSTASQKTRDAISRYLDATAGSEEYFTLVERYQIAAQSATLLKLATEQAGTPKAGESLKLLLKLGQQEVVKTALPRLSPEIAGALTESLASVGTQEAVALAMGILTDPVTSATIRDKAVKALGMCAAGQQSLLTTARAGQLPEDVKAAAAAALTTSTDEAVRTEAATLFQMAAKKPLPPIAEMAKRSGDEIKGQEVFMTYCFSCHQVNGLGIDFGPGLSEIGTKLAKEALYEAILKPSAGISFGYEGYEVKTKNGDTFIGMVASDTADELSLKVPGGVIQKNAKGYILSKTPLIVSLMTPGLDTVMEESQLVDLVEYLSALKKK